MCWNASVSLNTYIFSTFACTFAFLNGVITVPELLMLQSFMSMQLVEYFTWKHISSLSINKLLSQVALLLILIQPIFSIFCLNDKRYIPYLLGGYLVFLLILFVFIKPWNTIKFKMQPASNGHLAWHWLEFPLYVLLIWLFFFIIRHYLNKDWLTLIPVVFLVVVSYILYHKTNTWGSIWCWFANATAFLLVGLVFWKELCLKTN
jgi:hypothetical protein